MLFKLDDRNSTIKNCSEYFKPANVFKRLNEKNETGLFFVCLKEFSWVHIWPEGMVHLNFFEAKDYRKFWLLNSDHWLGILSPYWRNPTMTETTKRIFCISWLISSGHTDFAIQISWIGSICNPSKSERFLLSSTF